MKSEAKKAIKKVRQVGNSYGILLPKLMLEGVADVNDDVQVMRVRGYIVIAPIPKRTRAKAKRLKEGLH